MWAPWIPKPIILIFPTLFLILITLTTIILLLIISFHIPVVLGGPPDNFQSYDSYHLDFDLQFTILVVLGPHVWPSWSSSLLPPLFGFTIYNSSCPGASRAALLALERNIRTWCSTGSLTTTARFLHGCWWCWWCWWCSTGSPTTTARFQHFSILAISITPSLTSSP